jgi:large subunit ribosomal protein L30
MAQLEIRQIRSANGASPKQHDALRSLRLGRIGRVTKREDSPQLQGQLRKVGHLVEIDGGS